VGSVLAAAAPNAGTYICGHVLQGLATSMLLIAAAPPLTIGYPKDKLRHTAVIMNMCVFGAVALGPFIGGVQAAAHAWRPLFWIVAAIALMAADLVRTDRHNHRPMRDPWVTKMWRSPATVVSTTLKEPLDWPDATVVSRDAVDVVAGLKEESDVPLRSHGSLSMNRALMAAGLVDHVQVTLFPVITGQTGLNAIFQGAQDFDLELVEHRTLDSHIQELIYRPTLH
jgi:MFS family permease